MNALAETELALPTDSVPTGTYGEQGLPALPPHWPTPPLLASVTDRARLGPPADAGQAGASVSDWLIAPEVIRGRTPAEILDNPNKTERFILDGILHADATLLTGPPKSGKTFLLSDLARSVATGEPWCDRPVRGGARNVLVLPYDPGGDREYAERIGRAVGPGVTIVSSPPWIGDHRGWAQLYDLAVQQRIGLVIFDNWYGANPTGDINATSDVGATRKALDGFIRRGMAVVAAHHPVKGKAKGPAGSGSIPAWARSLVELDAHGQLTVTGNHAPKVAYQLERNERMRSVSLGPAHRDPGGRRTPAGAEAVGAGERKSGPRKTELNDVDQFFAGRPAPTSARDAAAQLTMAKPDLGSAETLRKRLAELARQHPVWQPPWLSGT